MLLLDYHILNDISWLKPNASPNLSCKYFTASHETLIWARKNKKSKHYFNYEAMKDGSFPKDFIKKPNTQMRSVWAISTPSPNEKIYGKVVAQCLALNRLFSSVISFSFLVQKVEQMGNINYFQHKAILM